MGIHGGETQRKNYKLACFALFFGFLELDSGSRGLKARVSHWEMVLEEKRD